MRRKHHALGPIVVLCFATMAATADEPSAAPPAEIPVPKAKFVPRIHYPPQLTVQHIEGRVVAHYKIDNRGHPFDIKLEFDATSKPLGWPVKDFLRSLLYDVPANWNRSASPVYDLAFDFVICPHTAVEGAPPAKERFLVTSCMVPFGTQPPTGG